MAKTIEIGLIVSVPDEEPTLHAMVYLYEALKMGDVTKHIGAHEGYELTSTWSKEVPVDDHD
jgi:hypothetical protein